MYHVTLTFDEWCYGSETVKLGFTSVTFTFDLWSFAWTSRLSMVITPENFRMIRWQEHCEKCVMDWRQMDRSVLRAAWSQLKFPYDHQAAILKVTSVKNNMYLPTATTHMQTKFETEIPKQIWVTLQKPCHLQSLQTKNPIWLPDSHFEDACHWKSIQGCELGPSGISLTNALGENLPPRY